MAAAGWRERVEKGLYRYHRASCPSSTTKRPSRSCGCPLCFQVAGDQPGQQRTVRAAATSLRAVRAERARIAAGVERVASSSSKAPTLDEYAARYLNAHRTRLSPHTVTTYDRDLRLRIAPHLGERRIDRITRTDVNHWVARIRKDCSYGLVRSAHATLRLILAEAVWEELISSNPASQISLGDPPPDGRKAAQEVLTPQQVSALLEHGARNLRIKTMLMAATIGCLRRGEIVGLRWSDVDLAAQEIFVARNAVQAPDWEGGDPDSTRKRMKVPKGRRAQVIGMDPVFRDALDEWKSAEVSAGRGRPQDPVWPGADDGPMGAGTPGQALARAMRRTWPDKDWGKNRAGGPKKNAKPLTHGIPAPPWVTLHGLRHTGASIALADGQALIDVSGQLRHADPGVTAKVYAHLLDKDQLKKVARSIGTALRDAGAAPSLTPPA